MSRDPEQADEEDSAERRKFLKSCGEFAAVTPPAIALLLSTSLTSQALAFSAGAERGGKPGPHPNPVPGHVPRVKQGHVKHPGLRHEKDDD